MDREEAKKMAQSRDCHCVKGEDRDNNYNECIDAVFDWHEKTIKDKKFTMEDMLLFAESCMVNLVSTKPEQSEYSEITSEDLSKIKKIINKFKK